MKEEGKEELEKFHFGIPEYLSRIREKERGDVSEMGLAMGFKKNKMEKNEHPALKKK